VELPVGLLNGEGTSITSLSVGVVAQPVTSNTRTTQQRREIT
jgi:hypothetical protein